MGEAVVSILWMVYPVIAQGQAGAFSLALILLLSFIIRNGFWLLRYNKLVIMSIELHNDEFQLLRDGSEEVDAHHLTPRGQSF